MAPPTAAAQPTKTLKRPRDQEADHSGPDDDSSNHSRLTQDEKQVPVKKEKNEERPAETAPADVSMGQRETCESWRRRLKAGDLVYCWPEDYSAVDYPQATPADAKAGPRAVICDRDPFDEWLRS
jgi:hypothetical protein